MMRILVTGSAGFIGSWIADKLSEEHEVLGVDDLSEGSGENIKNHTFQYCDLTNKAQTMMTFEKFEPDIVYHLAACAREGAGQFQPFKITRTGYYLGMNVLEESVRTDVEKFILFSSMAVYGNQEPPFSEEDPRQPVDIYGVGKSSLERSLEILADVHDFSYVVLRPHNVFGERQSLSDPYRNVVGIFMNRIMRDEPLLIYGDGEQKRAFSYILDSLPAYEKAMTLENEEVNIGGMKSITINHLAELVKKEMGAESHKVKHIEPRPREVREAVTTFKKSKELLGYEEIYGMKNGLSRMANWAIEKGPQKWKHEELPLKSPKMPHFWK